MSLRSWLYLIARWMGWVNAAAKGKLPQRALRVLLHRKTGGWINRIK